MKSIKSYILCIEQKKLLKKYINKGLIQNGYYSTFYKIDTKSKTSKKSESNLDLSMYYTWKNI